jgi:hypothetical protein
MSVRELSLYLYTYMHASIDILIYPPVRPSIPLSVHLCISPSIYPSVYLYPSVCLCLSVYLSIDPSIHSTVDPLEIGNSVSSCDRNSYCSINSSPTFSTCKMRFLTWENLSSRMILNLFTDSYIEFNKRAVNIEIGF